jgi:hypothetical protein
MRPILRAIAAALAIAGPWLRADDIFDSLEQHLAVSTPDDFFRVHLSGTLDLEEYAAQDPDPGLLVTNGRDPLFVPRLSVFLDAQAGPYLYVFVQSRVDRGFDPGYDQSLGSRLDEYAVRFTPAAGDRFNLQVGKFATVVGNWTLRHSSWDNPFITAPLPYNTLTGVWDAVAATSVPELLQWAHVVPFPAAVADRDKQLRMPIIWGPSYATGAAVFGDFGLFRYAAEVKNASLSSRPDEWSPDQRGWSDPTFSGRLGLRPAEAWDLGFSASEGPYLRDSAESTVPLGRSFGSYREEVLGQDVSYAWHHFQAWAELYEARFEIPAVTNADTAAYYVEAKYKFTPQFSGAIRWNQQLYATVAVPGMNSPRAAPVAAGRRAWGDDLWRIDFAPAYRFTPYLQLKLQLSLEEGAPGSSGVEPMTASQLTIRW